LNRVAALNRACVALTAGLRAGCRGNGGGNSLSLGGSDRHWWDTSSGGDRKNSGKGYISRKLVGDHSEDWVMDAGRAGENL